MKLFLLSVTLAVLIQLSVGDQEKAEHGAHHKHFTEDGEHNPHFDHEAILGSRKEEEEFEELPPEEAKKRLGLLAFKMDTDSDGKVTEEELYLWTLNSLNKLDAEDAMEQMKEQDKDEDEAVTWEEYTAAQGYDAIESEDEEMKKMMVEDEARFKAADLNKNGKLEKDEYLAFMLPQNYEHMHDIEIQNKLNAVDKDNDGRVSKEEFTADSPDIEQDRQQFDEFDKDPKDGYLNRKEMEAWVLIDNKETAREEAKHLMGIGDDDKDDVLTYQEIMDHHEEFVGSQVTDYGGDLHSMKDEL